LLGGESKVIEVFLNEIIDIRGSLLWILQYACENFYLINFTRFQVAGGQTESFFEYICKIDYKVFTTLEFGG